MYRRKNKISTLLWLNWNSSNGYEFKSI